MTSRGRAVVALVWGVLVTTVLIGLPLALRDRLPDPLATHWDGGFIPDGHTSFGGSVLADLFLWGVGWAFLLGTALRGTVLDTRLWRALWWGFLFGWAVFALGVQGLALYANLDVADWRQAVLPGWLLAAVLGSALAAGAVAGLLGRGEPDPPRDHPVPPSMRLRPGRRAVWVSRTTNPWLVGLSTAALLALVVAGVLFTTGILTDGAAWISLIVLIPLTLFGFATSSISARADEKGLSIGFGPLGRPVHRTPIGEIEAAWVENYGPSRVGGWGVRGMPGTGRITLMLRGGECLVVRRVTGAEIAVSVDDAEHGAALLNAYTAETVTS
ncbi:hypothetical protein [Streptosporangium sp. NPDC006007]|uniref:hypothetical protein n=1 Tax=Streptosporangium sp. NPDC006007 TaxID=3154575 RepID=UPI0033B16DD7